MQKTYVVHCFRKHFSPTTPFPTSSSLLRFVPFALRPTCSSSHLLFVPIWPTVYGDPRLPLKVRLLIRRDEWIERFKNPSTLPEDIIHTLRQEWAAYLLERWS
ncbi:hypothetical protein DEO72_LG10g2468 [Vigna unguiculata]|uniref:Uncharacterized protein n=1 Tax=Vigna unguiculata TaxID=3917 RepID=A0A4D6NGE0_VIGUN|nr:hypothetical protein DEO72_LG10g2468 [Vigna unguiculata]